MAEHRLAPARDSRPLRLRVDPTACAGVGICAHLAAGLVELDRWGFPILSGEALLVDRAGEPTGELARQAAAAERACPHRALFLDAAD